MRRFNRRRFTRIPQYGSAGLNDIPGFSPESIRENEIARRDSRRREVHEGLGPRLPRELTDMIADLNTQNEPARELSEAELAGAYERAYRDLRRQDVNYGLGSYLPGEITDMIADIGTQQNIESARQHISNIDNLYGSVGNHLNAVRNTLNREFDIRDGNAAIDVEDGHGGNRHLWELSDAVINTFTDLESYLNALRLAMPAPDTYNALPAYAQFQSNVHPELERVRDNLYDVTRQVTGYIDTLPQIFPVVPGYDTNPEPLFNEQHNTILDTLDQMSQEGYERSGPSRWFYASEAPHHSQPSTFNDRVHNFYNRLRQHNPRLAAFAAADLQAERRNQLQRDREREENERNVRRRLE